MNDDWRLRIDLNDDGHAAQLNHELDEHPPEIEGLGSAGDRMVVSHDGPLVFIYAGTRQQADVAQREVQTVVDRHGWSVEFELRHWHPTAEQWEDPDTPLPETDAQLADERRERMAQERADSEAEGYPDFEVTVHCHSHRDANRLAEKLEQEGIPFTHRWSTVMVGAEDEDSAAALADRLRAEVPEGSEVTVEGNLRAVYDERPGRRFWMLGGLGG